MGKRTYYMVNSASCSYGAYESIEDAIKQAETDGTVKTITKIVEECEVIWTKPDYEISSDDVYSQLVTSFELDEKENSYLSKDALDWLIKHFMDKKGEE